MNLNDEQLQQYLSTLSEFEQAAFKRLLKKANHLSGYNINSYSETKLEKLRLERKKILEDINAEKNNE